ncbi:MAG: DUF1684 domain-containing protein [Kineosporiaceae bacterium]
MSALEVLDWRRRVRDLYAAVRAVPDAAAGHRLWRTGRDELMAHHPASPLRSAVRERFRGLPVAPYDPSYRFEVEVHAVAGDARPARFEAVTGTDGVVPFERVGVVVLPGLGSVDVWWLASYGGGLFLPLRDGSAGRPGGTFGGGRYVLDTVKGADLGQGRAPGSLVVDLNFAYQPSCAYDAAWACPLAPPGNQVDTPIPVGELVAA